MEISHERVEGETDAADQPEPVVVGDHALAMVDEAGSVRTLEDIEASMIRFAIKHHKGRMTSVARSLGIGRSTLYRKLKEYGIEDNTSQENAA